MNLADHIRAAAVAYFKREGTDGIVNSKTKVAQSAQDRAMGKRPDALSLGRTCRVVLLTREVKEDNGVIRREAIAHISVKVEIGEELVVGPLKRKIMSVECDDPDNKGGIMWVAVIK